jgi:hypothetical protein
MMFAKQRAQKGALRALDQKKTALRQHTLRSESGRGARVLLDLHLRQQT